MPAKRCPEVNSPRVPAMLRFLFSLYTTGIVVFFVLFLVFVPKIPLVDAVVGALIWPWGVYRYFVDGSGYA